MSKAREVASLALLLLLVVTTIVMAESVAAQSTSKPSVPEFTVSVTDHSYDVPAITTTTTDFDGRRITTMSPGYHMLNGSITLSIKNQPFTPYYDSDGYPINLYYHIRVKLDDPVYWRYFPGEDQYYPATNSTYTTFTYGYQGHDFVHEWGGMPAYSSFRPDGTIDFGVEAFIGHTNTTYRFSGCPVIRSQDLIVKYVGATSGWSESQTATIPNGAYTPTTPNPTLSPAPTAPTLTATPWPYQNPTETSTGLLIEFSFSGPQWDPIELAVAIAVGIVLALLVAVIFFMRRKIRVLELGQNGA